MKTSENIVELVVSLLKAQKKFPKIVKDRRVKFKSVDYSYAELDQIKSKCDPILSEFGLIVINGWQGENFVTRLQHDSGQFMESSVDTARFKSDRNDPKEHGSLETYLKRYGYCALTGIVSEEDRDYDQPAQKKSGISQAQQKRLYAIATSNGYTQAQIKDVLVKEGKSSSADLSINEYNVLIALIEKKQLAISSQVGTSHPDSTKNSATESLG